MVEAAVEQGLSNVMVVVVCYSERHMTARHKHVEADIVEWVSELWR